MVSFPAAAQGLLNSHQSVDVKASIWKVWDAVKDFDGLNKWHPMFSDDVIKSGANEEIGSVRTMTVKDGPSFDEELLSFDALEKKFSYRVIDPAPLPISDYVSSPSSCVKEHRYATTIIRRTPSSAPAAKRQSFCHAGVAGARDNLNSDRRLADVLLVPMHRRLHNR
jgi:hypothetical protein